MYRVRFKLGVITQVGMTLLEVMLTLSLSTFVITTLTALYLHFHHAMGHQLLLQAHQRDARKIDSLLTDEIALAGHIGCARLSPSFQVIPFLNNTLTSNNKIETDGVSLTLRYQSFPNAALIAASSHPAKLECNRGLRFYPNQIVIISDCQHAEIFQVKSVHLNRDSQVIESTQPLHFLYHPYAEIGHYIVHQYQMQGFALLRIDNNMRKNTILSNIEKLNFSDDGKGVSYHYVTRHQSSIKSWSGYAAKG